MKKVALKREVMFSHHTLWYDLETEPNLALLLAEVPLIPSLEQIAYMLHRIVTRKKHDKDFHPRELLQWILKQEGDTQKRATNHVTGENPFTIEGFRLTNRTICLSLIEQLLKYARGNAPELTSKHQSSLFEALLVMNGRYLATQVRMFNWDGTGDEKTFLDVILPAKISSLGISKLRDHQVALIKAAYFFGFCESDTEYIHYLNAFLKIYDFPSYREYLRAIIVPYLTYTAGEVSSPKLRVDPEYLEAISFFKRISINDHPISGEDFKTLRQYPIFQCDANTFLFLSHNFFVDKLFQGLLFDFAQVLQQGEFPEMNYGKLKNDLGNRFSEHHLFYRTMELCFGNFGQLRRTGDALKMVLKQGEPDYYIRDGRKVFVFEFKDAQLRSDIKVSASAEVIREELSEKLDITTKAQPKAIRQLLNSIVRICEGTYSKLGIDTFDAGQLMIYPVLVHTDNALETEGVNYFLKEKMNKLISDAGLPKYRIKDLVVLNLDMLLSIQDLFYQKKINLGTCINEFIAYAQAHGPLNRMMPFDEFLKFYLMKKHHSFLKAPNEFNRLIKSFAGVD